MGGHPKRREKLKIILYMPRVKTGTLSRQKGFTIVEMLIVSFAIGLIAAILLANMRRGNGETNLRFAVQNLANVSKQAQTMAANGKTVDGSVPWGIGVHLTSNSAYTLFADKNNDGLQNAGEVLEIISLPSSITMNRNNDTILFQSPHGTTQINGQGTGSLTVTFTNNAGQTGTVSIYASSGLIESSF